MSTFRAACLVMALVAQSACAPITIAASQEPLSICHIKSQVGDGDAVRVKAIYTSSTSGGAYLSDPNCADVFVDVEPADVMTEGARALERDIFKNIAMNPEVFSYQVELKGIFLNRTTKGRDFTIKLSDVVLFNRISNE